MSKHGSTRNDMSILIDINLSQIRLNLGCISMPSSPVYVIRRQEELLTNKQISCQNVSNINEGGKVLRSDDPSSRGK